MCDATGTPRPVAAQMACSLADHAAADDPAMLDVLGRGPIGLVAAFVLAGGALTGKYLDGAGRGRADHSSLPERGRQLAASVVQLAGAWGVAPAQVAFCFALAHPRLASVLFGATSPEQVATNVGSVALFESLSGAQVQELVAMGDTGAA